MEGASHTVAVTISHSASHLNNAHWIQQLNPEGLPLLTLCAGLAGTMKGGTLELHRHCLSRPEEPPCLQGAVGHEWGRQVQDVLCQSQSDPKVLSAVLGDICPMCCCLRPAPAVTEPIERCVQDVTGEGSELWTESQTPGLIFLGFPPQRPSCVPGPTESWWEASLLHCSLGGCAKWDAESPSLFH